MGSGKTIAEFFSVAISARVLRKRSKTIQIDGGSEFKDQFDEAYRSKEIPLFVLPPKSPKFNGHMERSDRTHREEFYEVYDVALDLEEHNIIGDGNATPG